MFNKLLPVPIRNQYLAVFLANLISFIHGSAIAWFSPALLILNSKEDTPLTDGPMTSEQTSYVASTIFIGSIIGNLVSGQITSRFGNRITLISMAIPQFIWWGLVALADHYWYLVIARFFIGYTGGSIYKVIPYYVADIAQPDIRGKLGTMFPLMYNGGTLFGFILGEYVPYKYIPLSFIMSVGYILGVWFCIPESPPYLLSKGQIEKALHSLLFYRSASKKTAVSDSIRKEFDGLTKFQETQKSKVEISWRSFVHSNARFGMIMSIFLALLLQFSGFMALMQFTATIFVEAGSSLAANEAAMIVALIQILGTVCSIFVVDRFGRKVLLLTSCLGTAIFLGCLGAYSFLDQHGFEVVQYNWIPIVSFCAGIFSMSIGILAVSITIMTEILLPELKNQGIVLANMIGSVGGFGIFKLFPIMLDEIQVYGVMWFFSGSCLFGLLITAIFLPETKGRNLNK